MLDEAEFGGVPINERAARQLIDQGQDLLRLADGCVANLTKCAK
jgi:hypothetical protein